MARYTGTVTLATSSVSIGDTLNFTFTSSDPKVWACLESFASAGGACKAWLPVYQEGTETYFIIGPTPSWSSGPGAGKVYLRHFNTRKGTFDPPYAEASFTVTG